MMINHLSPGDIAHDVTSPAPLYPLAAYSILQENDMGRDSNVVADGMMLTESSHLRKSRYYKNLNRRVVDMLLLVDITLCVTSTTQQQQLVKKVYGPVLCTVDVPCTQASLVSLFWLAGDFLVT